MTQKKVYRMVQVNRLLQEEIAEILLTDLQDERLKDLTITEVRTSKDLKHAIVFITMHKHDNCDEMLDVTQRSARLIRKLLYSRIRLKHIPELEFRYDESLDRAERIFRTLNQLKEEMVESDQ